jgi:hypothetical protein
MAVTVVRWGAAGAKPCRARRARQGRSAGRTPTQALEEAFRLSPLGAYWRMVASCSPGSRLMLAPPRPPPSFAVGRNPGRSAPSDSYLRRAPISTTSAAGRGANRAIWTSRRTALTSVQPDGRACSTAARNNSEPHSRPSNNTSIMARVPAERPCRCWSSSQNWS